MNRIFATVPLLAFAVACAEGAPSDLSEDGVSPERLDDAADGSSSTWAAPDKDAFEIGGPSEGFGPEPDPTPETGGSTDNPSEYPGIPGFEPPAGWQRANVPDGAYWMQYGEVYAQPTSDFPVQPGHREVIVAPEIEGYAYLFGTAPILTDLNSLMADGVRYEASDEGDCTITHTVEADGWHTGETSFDMHVIEIIETVGSDCVALEKGTPGTETWEYLASFSWMPPEGP